MKMGFKFPRRTRLVYFGQTGLSLLQNYITENDYTIYVGGRTHLNVWVFLRALLLGKPSELNYYHAFLKWTKPHYVITMEDNSLIFYATKAFSPSTTAISIQNGIRGEHSHTPTKSFTADLRGHIQSGYGADVIATMGQIGSQYFDDIFLDSVSRTRIVGSLRNNAIEVVAGDPESRRLIFVSSFPNLGATAKFQTEESRLIGYWGTTAITLGDFYRIEGEAAQHCAVIAQELQMPFVVLGKRPEWQVGEKAFYSGYLNSAKWEFHTSENEASSYKFVQSRDIIVNVDSTFGYEMFSRGSRVAFLSARMHCAGYPKIISACFGQLAGLSQKGRFWTDELTMQESRRVISFAAQSSDTEWELETSKLHSTLIIHDPRNTLFCSMLSSFGIRNSGPQWWNKALIPNN